MALTVAVLLAGGFQGMRAQIGDNEASVNALAIQCAISSGADAESYRDYSQSLAKTLALMSPAQQKRIFGYVPTPSGTGFSNGPAHAGSVPDSHPGHQPDPGLDVGSGTAPDSAPGGGDGTTGAGDVQDPGMGGAGEGAGQVSSGGAQNTGNSGASGTHPQDPSQNQGGSSPIDQEQGGQVDNNNSGNQGNSLRDFIVKIVGEINDYLDGQNRK